MDFSVQATEQNDGFRLALIVVDIFSRKVWAVPLKSKPGSPAAIA
jgi:hypothetical protein